MLDRDQRTAILQLKARGQSIRAIARAMKVCRDSVREVLRTGTQEVPALDREAKGTPWHDAILELHARCKGNLVRVQEELMAQGAVLSYQALTAYCRRHGIGVEPKLPAGSYHFDPAQEMQHDTSPHRVRLGGRERLLQDASLVLCHSRMLFHQYYPTFDRFWCKVFLTEAFRYFGGVCACCMIDNTHVVVQQGTGAAMIAVPEMVAFSERFGFTFRAHERGHANRSARVERNFDYIENNFLAGREFQDWEDLNRQAREWCEKVNATPKRHLHASPRDLFALERTLLKPLPLWIPPVYRLSYRTVDQEGYVHVNGNRFSVPYPLVGRQLEVREGVERIEVFQGQVLVADHGNPWDRLAHRISLPEHRPPRREGGTKAYPYPEEVDLLRLEPGLAGYVAALKAHGPGRAVRALRRLLTMAQDYPREPFLAAVATALAYGLFDLDRLDRMVLRHIAKDYFVLDEAVPDPCNPPGGPHEG